jgi:hypothetical protein
MALHMGYRFRSAGGIESMKKQTWAKPELTVLVRSKPEEAVLTSCKGNTTSTNPRGRNGACNERGRNCSAILPS